MSGSRPTPRAIAAHPETARWIALEEEGVVDVLSGRVELGQGITAALRKAVAAELDVAPRRVRVRQGDTALTPDEGRTVGSQSVSEGVAAARLAAASARAELLSRAAAMCQCERDALSVADGAVHRAGEPTGLTFWSLTRGAPLAGTVDPQVMLRRRVRDTDTPALRRDELLARLRGEAFIHDMVLPLMLHGRVLHGPFGASRLLTDGAAVAALLPEGVRLVREGEALALLSEHEDLLETAEQAVRPALAFACRMAAADPAEALMGDLQSPASTTHWGDGAQEGAAEASDVSVELMRGCLAHASIGPSCALAHASGGTLTVVSHTQGPHALRSAIAGALGLDESAVRVVFAPGAGCYGHNSADDAAFDAAWLAGKTEGRPVRVTWCREDEFGAAPLGPAMRTRAVATLAQGRVARLALDVVSPGHSTRPAGPSAPNFKTAELLDPPRPIAASVDPPAAAGGGSDRNAVPLYAIASGVVRVHRPAETRYRPSSFRGLGAQVNVAAIEMAMDAAAQALGEDPAALRLRHLTDPRAAAVIERVSEAAAAVPCPRERTRGLGFARYKNRAGYCAVIAEIEVAHEIAVPRVFAAADVGEIVDARGVRQQVDGGIVQALSIALLEDVQFHSDGIATQTLDDYAILRFPDVPDITTVLVDRPDEPPLGAGEIAAGPATAALLNAVSRALGVRPTRLPLTRERLMALLA